MSTEPIGLVPATSIGARAASDVSPPAAELRLAPLAAGLSFIFPGLGQAFNRQPSLAALFALPMVGVLGLGWLAAGHGSSLISSLLDVRILGALILLDAAFLGWRLVAIAQAHYARGWAGFRHWTTVLTAILLIATVGMHVVPAWYGVATVGTLSAIAEGGSGGGGIFYPNNTLPPGASATAEPTPPTERPGINGRLTVLLVGIDYIPARAATYLTDTMIVATIDPLTGIDLISVPRDTFGTPLGDGRIYNEKLNSLLARAQRLPDAYPLGGPETLKAAVGQLVGLKIDYIAAIQVLGFKKAVDALGGVDVTVERSVADPTYVDEFEHHNGFYIDPGQYHMDGHQALGFARSRKGVGDSDFTRAARQQQLLVALFHKLTAENLIVNFPALLDIVRDSVATDVPVSLLPDVAQALQFAAKAPIDRLVLQYPYTHNGTLTDGTYILVPDIPAIQEAVRQMLQYQPGSTPPPG